jgi:hypothetical protein
VLVSERRITNDSHGADAQTGDAEARRCLPGSVLALPRRVWYRHRQTPGKGCIGRQALGAEIGPRSSGWCLRRRTVEPRLTRRPPKPPTSPRCCAVTACLEVRFRRLGSEVDDGDYATAGVFNEVDVTNIASNDLIIAVGVHRSDVNPAQAKR